ncbi:MAG TPA: SCO family protein [Thermoleophilaceae bacterium]|jgi:protein SCO1/2
MQRIGRSALVPLVLVLVVAGAATAVLAIGSSGGGTKLPGNAKKQAPAGGFRGATITPVQQAPPIALHNYLGKPVSLSQYRGKAVLVTFLYVHCPDVCPAIASALRVVRQKLGPEKSKMQIIAVSVDPRGDKPSSVARFLDQRRMTGQMQYLVGSSKQLVPVWQAWNVGSQRDASNPEFVAHTALIYGISGSGKLRTIYPANFKPADIVHDVPQLASS